MPDPTSAVHDPKVLRAIAHPVRNRILTELTATGSMRAADVARELDIPANQASFHLRQLAKYGLVEEDPDAARDRRDRVWRPVSTHGLTLNLDQIAEAPGGAGAVGVFRRNATAWGRVIVEHAFAEPTEEGIHRSSTDQALRLTPEEARELTDDLVALAERWGERTRGAPGERRTYLLFTVVQPYPDVAFGREP